VFAQKMGVQQRALDGFGLGIDAQRFRRQPGDKLED
jgi:hypothetical protein